jgi:hypothetical protein
MRYWRNTYGTTSPFGDHVHLDRDLAGPHGTVASAFSVAAREGDLAPVHLEGAVPVE